MLSTRSRKLHLNPGGLLLTVVIENSPAAAGKALPNDETGIVRILHRARRSAGNAARCPTNSRTLHGTFSGQCASCSSGNHTNPSSRLYSGFLVTLSRDGQITTFLKILLVSRLFAFWYVDYGILVVLNDFALAQSQSRDEKGGRQNAYFFHTNDFRMSDLKVAREYHMLRMRCDYLDFEFRSWPNSVIRGRDFSRLFGSAYGCKAAIGTIDDLTRAAMPGSRPPD